MKKKFTKFYDDQRNKIYVGDLLYCNDGYFVIAQEYEDSPNNFYGKLVCHENHSCKNIGYCLNKGINHLKCSKNQMVIEYEGKTSDNDFRIEKNCIVIVSEENTLPEIYNFKDFRIKLHVKGILTICKIYLNL
jgi:hypothetical protein